MKKMIMMLALIIVPFASNCQEVVKTTFDEYKFLSESFGYQDDVKMLDGYEFKDLFEQTRNIYNFQFKRFVKTETGKTQAILVKITKIKKKEDKVVYLCIPFNDEGLYKRYYQDVEKLGTSMYLHYDALNRELVMSLFNDIYNKE